MTLGLATGMAAAALMAPPPAWSPVQAAGPTIDITPAGGAPLGVPVPLGPCPSGEGSDYCVAPDPAMATAGDTVSWVNNSGAPHHLVGSGVTTHQAFEVAIDGPGGSATFPVSDTYSYSDSLHPEVKGTLIVSARSGGGGGSVAPPTAQPGQSLGQVTGAGTAKPRVVAAPALGIVTGPPDVGPAGSRALPPITASPTAEPDSAPAIATPAPTQSSAPTPVAASTTSTTDGLSWVLYAGAALLLLVALSGGGLVMGMRWRHHRREEGAAA